MAEAGSDEPASPRSYWRNAETLSREAGDREVHNTARTMRMLRSYLDRSPTLKGFKRGGRVHRTGIYKLHRGERVVPARSKRRSRR